MPRRPHGPTELIAEITDRWNVFTAVDADAHRYVIDARAAVREQRQKAAGDQPYDSIRLGAMRPGDSVNVRSKLTVGEPT